ncbi:mannitol-1-phosphate 5-dehydrogenase [Paenibacillus sp. y28]|uniref:mannitol-1-phosphate 5-dehydrogenase n=1 Tax=Paenibacillus sp. y28 TaxID=3129110 RepID=UPI00301B29CC
MNPLFKEQTPRKAVHFGAGNIGRGFIGLMLSRSGYEVCFVARNKEQVALLQQEQQYTVTLANEAEDTAIVKNITAVHVQNDEALMENIATADLITTAVGTASLPHIAEAIAQGIERRLEENVRPLHVIACENAVGGSSQLKKWVYTYLKPETHAAAERYVSFPNTSVDRIVPVQPPGDPLTVKVEPFYEWIIHRAELKKGFQEIKGVRYVDSLEPFVERKLFTVNTGHCTAAYYGYLAGYQTIQQAMKDARIREKVRQVLHETGSLLVHKYELDEQEHTQYIHKTLERFANPGLTDKIVRVGRSPLRKLSMNDRLVRPALQACRYGIEAPHLASAIAAALLFDYAKDPEAVKLQAFLRQEGIGPFITRHMGIPEVYRLHRQITAGYDNLRQRRPLIGTM